jgi:predicted aldo/keto reductase-like oxidoreductase
MEQDRKQISRRKFLAGAAALSSAPIIASCSGSGKMPLSSDVKVVNPNDPSVKSQAGLMPKRTYGKTGLSVSILGFGCGSKFSSLPNPAGRYAALDAALAGGINYFDCASEYGTASTLGNYWAQTTVPTPRSQVIIVDKLNARDYTGAKNEFASQLTQLKMTYVDVLLCHALPSDLDLTALGSATGAWQFLKEAKQAGTAKFIGFSSMDNTAAAAGGVLPRFVTDLNPDVCTLAMSRGGYGNCKNVTLPIANTANCGVGAIKTLLGQVSTTYPVDVCLKYLWDLVDANQNPRIATLIVGHDGGASQVDANVAIAKAYVTGVLSYNREQIERDARPLANANCLPWMRPDFKDNGQPYFWA